jgi:exonuclease SbcC
VKPLKLSVKGFKPFKDEQIIDFQNLDFFVIRGPTGSGKSSLLDAILFALYGETVEGLRKEDILNKESSLLRVDFEFAVRGKKYRVIRSFGKKGAIEVRFFIEGKPKSVRVRELNDEISKILGVGAKQFQKIFFLPQGRYASFLKGKAAERRELVLSLLDLEIYKKIQEAASERFKTLENNLELIRTKLKDLQKYDAEYLANLQREYQTKLAEKEKLSKEVSQQRKEIDRLNQLKEKYELFQSLAKELQNLNKENIDQIKQKVEILEKLNQRREIFVNALSLEREIQELEPTIEGLEKEVKELQKEIDKHQKELNSIIQQREEFKSSKEPLIGQLQIALGKLEELEKKAVELKKLNQEIEDINKILADKNKKLKNIEEKIKQKEDKIKNLTQQLESVKYDPEEEANLKALKEKAIIKAKQQEELTKVINKLRENKEQKDRYETTLKQLEEFRINLQKEYEKLKSLRKEYFIYELIRELKPGEPCPICGRPLEKEHLQRSTTDFDPQKFEKIENQLKELNEKIFRLQAGLEHLQNQLEELKKQKAELEEELEQYKEVPPLEEIKERSQTLEKNKQKKQKLEEELEILQKELELLKGKKQEKELEVQKYQTLVKEKEKTFKEELNKAKTKKVEIAKQVGIDNPEIKLKELKKQLKEILNTLEKEKERLEKLKEEKEKLINANKSELKGKETQLETLKGVLQKKKKEYQNLKKEIEKLLKQLQLEKYPKEIFDELEKLNQLKEEIEKWKNKQRELEIKIKNLKEELKEIDPQKLKELEELRKELTEKEKQLEEITTQIGAIGREIEETKKRLEEKEKLQKEEKELTHQWSLLKELKEDFQADRLQDFVVSKALEEIVELAGEYLWKLTDRYRFIFENEELLIWDLATDAKRAIATLSGGETFLASLSMALGFGAYLDKGAAVESLFIDEGFGTLDAEKLSRVEELFEIIKQRVNKTVGIITHLDSLASIFEKQIIVKPSPQGSKIEVFDGSKD